MKSAFAPFAVGDVVSVRAKTDSTRATYDLNGRVGTITRIMRTRAIVSGTRNGEDWAATIRLVDLRREAT